MLKKLKKPLFLGALFIFTLSVLYYFFFIFSFSGGCILKIQKARNPITQQVSVFPTPCDVPFGWQKIDY